MMSLIENETCAGCETQCLPCRDARVTVKWGEAPDDMTMLPIQLISRIKKLPQLPDDIRKELAMWFIDA